MMTFVNIFTCIFEAVVVEMIMHSQLDVNKNKKTNRFVYVLLLSLSIVLSNKFLKLGLINSTSVILITFFITYMFSKKIKINIIWSITTILILAAAEMIVLFLITSITNMSVKNIVDDGNHALLGTILSKLLGFFVLKYLCVKKDTSITNNVKTSYWILFLIIFLTSVMTIFLLFELQYENTSVIMHDLSVGCSIGVMYSAFFSLHLYEKTSKLVELEKQQKYSEMQNAALSKHTNELLTVQNEYRKFYHDTVNRNIVIKTFFEKQDYEGGLEFMDKLDSSLKFLNKVIDTGNAALDGIISAKKAFAESKGIIFETIIQIPENIFVNSWDLCKIFGNALDNCIEACDKIPEGKEKKISVYAIYDNDSLICRIENTTINSKNKALETTKVDKENHGLGIGIIKSALSNYKNICRFKQLNDRFILSIVIFKN